MKIADSGLAKIVGLTPAYLSLTAPHEVMGTLYYMAPEQVTRSHPVDHRADLVHWADRQAARLLVDSLVPLNPEAGASPAGAAGRLAPRSRRQRAGMFVLGPGLGLLAAALVVFAWYVKKVVALGRDISEAGGVAADQVPDLLAAAAALTGFICLVAGGIRMLQLRSYRLAVLAGVVALAPWPPAWGLCWPFGVWALAVLGHPTIKAAFRTGRRSAELREPSAPPSRRPVLGVVGGFARSCARSFLGYFVPGLSRVKVSPPAQESARAANGGLPPIGDAPLPATAAYLRGQASRRGDE